MLRTLVPVGLALALALVGSATGRAAAAPLAPPVVQQPPAGAGLPGLAPERFPQRATGGRPVVLRGPGVWSTADLGYERRFALTPGDDGSDSVGLRFRFPRGAAQGPQDWYILHLRFAITLKARQAQGSVVVDGSINSYAAAMVQFDTAWHGQPSRTRILHTSLLGGDHASTTSGRRIEVRYANYLQRSSVQDGEAVLRFGVREFAGADVEHVEILSAALERTPDPPAEIDLDVVAPEHPVRVGEKFVVRYTLTNIGGRPARRVGVKVSAAKGLEVNGPARRTYGTILPETPIKGRFEVTARRNGTYDLSVGVSGGTGNPFVVVTVPVGRASEASSGLYGWTGAAVVLLALGAYFGRRTFIRKG